MRAPRFLERFWSLFLIGELGLFRVLTSVARAVISIILLLLLVGGFGWLLLSLFPDLAVSIMVRLIDLVKVLVTIFLIWYLARLMFRR